MDGVVGMDDSNNASSITNGDREVNTSDVEEMVKRIMRPQ